MAVNYDDRLHQVYAQGRWLSAEALTHWAATFARLAPAERPLTVLDLGSGTGRFTPTLAETFGGPVYGVEPSARMRAVAEADATHERVSYLGGTAEAIPLPDSSCDLALLFLTFHHFADQPAALRELARVLRPGGVVLMRSQFADRMPDLYWYRYFPSARTVDAAMYRPLAEVRAMAAEAGLTADPEPVRPAADDASTLAELYDRIKLRALSTFEHLPEEEVELGFAEFAQDAAVDPDRPVPGFAPDLLVLRR
jgi:ubiquinone/menaquinone biosynthesis C-methylase UbiE